MNASCKDAEHWDVREVDRVTGQTIEHETKSKTHQGQEQQPLGRGVIQTWKNCKLYNKQKLPQSFKLNGQRFVAHVDTGNNAYTVITKEAFQELYPGGSGAVKKGVRCIRGATGLSEDVRAVEIQYELDDVVGPSNKPLRVTVDAIVMDRKGDFDILISTKDMQVFHDRFGFVIQPVSRDHFLRCGRRSC